MPRKANATAKVTTAAELKRLRQELEECQRERDFQADRLDGLEEGLEAKLERLGASVADLLATADEIEFHYRGGRLNAIREGGAEHPMFTDLFRAADKARRLLA